jgi:DNA-binding GntR family transcriptional regulator
MSLTNRAYDGLRRMVANGDLAPGARLVNRSLAKSLKVSQTPVREALGRLISEGVAEAVPGAGAFVRKVELDDLMQLYDLRELIEPFAAGAAARNASDFERAALADVCADWRELVTAIGKSKRPPGDALVQRWNDNEERFHRLILTASRNRFLRSSAENLRLLTAAFHVQRQTPRLLTPRSTLVTLREHAAIVNAVRRRDEKAAEQLMLKHIRNGRQQVMSAIRGK